MTEIFSIVNFDQVINVLLNFSKQHFHYPSLTVHLLLGKVMHKHNGFPAMRLCFRLPGDVLPSDTMHNSDVSLGSMNSIR